MPPIRSVTTLPSAGLEYWISAAASGARKTATFACCATSAAFQFFEVAFNFPSGQSNPLKSNIFARMLRKTAVVQNHEVRPNFAAALALNAVRRRDDAEICSHESRDHGADGGAGGWGVRFV